MILDRGQRGRHCLGPGPIEPNQVRRLAASDDVGVLCPVDNIGPRLQPIVFPVGTAPGQGVNKVKTGPAADELISAGITPRV